MTMDVGQAAIDSVVVIRECFVVDAEQMEDRGMEVGPGDQFFDSFPSDFIRFTISDPFLEPSASQPCCKSFRVVVAP